jgi:hypothetical protein
LIAISLQFGLTTPCPFTRSHPAWLLQQVELFTFTVTGYGSLARHGNKISLAPMMGFSPI